MKRFLSGLCAAILLTASVSAADATVIDTGTLTNDILSFGEPAFATYGQTFKLNPGDDTNLDSVTFYLNDLSNPDNVDFTFYLYEWNGARITGSSLFTSGMLSTTGSNGYETFTVDTGGVSLSTWTNYAFFISASNFFDNVGGTSSLGGSTDGYANGNFIYMSNGNNFGMLSTSNWGQLSYIDIASTMNLSSPLSQVPEPSTLLLLGSGLAGAGVLRRLKKN